MYKFFLDKIPMPITPSEMAIKIKNKNETLDLLNEGEINILKKAGLTEINFKLNLPNVESNYPFLNYEDGTFKNARYFLDKFEKWKQEKKVIEFIVVRNYGNVEMFDSKMRVSIEDYSINESAENGDWVEVELNLKQYKDYATKYLNIKLDKYKPRPVLSSTSNRGNNTGNAKGQFRSGATVIVNGRLHWDSWGRRPGQWRRNWKGKISHTNFSNGATHNIHVVTMKGEWQGWVKTNEVKVIG